MEVEGKRRRENGPKVEMDKTERAITGLGRRTRQKDKRGDNYRKVG